MSTFYGTLQGNRGEVTRCGDSRSGIRASVQSWDGSVITYLYEADGTVYAQIYAAPGSTSVPRLTGSRCVYNGPLAGLLKPKLKERNEAYQELATEFDQISNELADLKSGMALPDTMPTGGCQVCGKAHGVSIPCSPAPGFQVIPTMSGTPDDVREESDE